MIKASYFIDNKERNFIPYKGWSSVDSEGIVEQDNFTIDDEGPFKNIPDPLSPGNWHTLSNLLDSKGKKILKKGVRFIKYHNEGYYLLEDNNHDELSNKYHGCIPMSEYVTKMNVVNLDGKLLSDTWFDDVCPMVNGFYLVRRDEKCNLMDNSGKLLLKEFEPNLTNFLSGVAYSSHDGYLYSNSETTQKIIRKLYPLDSNLKYCCNAKREFYYDWVTGIELKEYLENSQLKFGTFIIQRDSDNKINLIDSNGFLVFDKWYQTIQYTSINGLFLIMDKEQWSLMDLGGNPIGHKFLDPITPFYGNNLLIREEKSYSIMNHLGETVLSGLTSAIWADKGIWGINVVHGNNKYHGFHGSGNAITNYAQQVLSGNKFSLMVEKNGTWYLITNDCNIIPFMKFPVLEATKNLQESYKQTSNDNLCS